MKAILSKVCNYFTASFFFFMLLAGTTIALDSPYDNYDCTYKNVFTINVKTTHNDKLCNKNSESLPHYFTGISALIISNEIKDKLLGKTGMTPDNLELFYADIIDNAAVLDIPLVSASLNEVWFTDYENPNLDNFYLFVCLHHKTYRNGSSQQIINENFNNTSQWFLFEDQNVPIDGYLSFPVSQPMLIKLSDLLSNKLTAQSKNPACEQIEISLESKCKFVINRQTTIYQGYPYRIAVSAESRCSSNTFTATPHDYPAYNSFNYTSNLFRWKYTHGDTDTYVPLARTGQNIVVMPTENPKMPIGKNILLRLTDGRASTSENTQVLCFYPDLPQPTKTKFQRIPEGSIRLDFLRLVFNRTFNAEIEEKATLLTVYSKVAQKADGSILPSESTVIFQEAFDPSKLSGTTYTTSVTSCLMKAGTYYVTVEGTVRNQSNNPNQNGSLPNNIKNAIFQVVPVVVGTNDFEVENVEFTPPSCFGQKGKLKVTINKYFIPAISKYPVFYYQKNTNRQTEPVYDTINFRCTYNGTQADPHATFECDRITAQHSLFKIVIPPIIESSSGGIIKSDTKNTTPSKGSLPNDPSNELVSFFSFTFSQPDPLRVPIEVKHLSGYYCTNGKLNMADDGKVTVFRKQASGGTKPYSFFFKDDYVNPNPTALNADIIPAPHAGYRHITLLDKNACRFDTSVFVSNLNTELCAEIAIERNISCYNANDGILTVLLKKQSGNVLKYEWYKNGTLIQNATGTILYNLGPGTYRVVVTDIATDIQSYDEISIDQPSQLKLNLQQKIDIDCFGNNNGTIAVSGSGGTPSYLYLWNGISYGSLRRELPAGNYEVKLIDQNSCETTQTYTINQPQSPFEIVIDSVIHAYYNASDVFVPGKILQHPQGGTKPYGALNSGGADLNRLNGGTYLLQQYDAHNCLDEKEVSITVFDRMRISIAQDGDNPCFGDSKASCHVLIEGGVPPFDISWSNGSKQTAIQNLPAGIYSVRVQDAVGVIRNATITITQPKLLHTDSLLVQNPSYYGCTDNICPPNAEDGKIAFSVTGGTLPYTFYWKKDNVSISLPQNRTQIDHLSAGNYLLEVHDANGCAAHRSFQLANIPSLRIEADILQGISCNGQASGIIQAKASGGTPPYRYAWKNLPETGDVAKNLNSETYTVTVSDALGIEAQTSQYMPQPDALRIHVDCIQSPSYPGSKNGMAFERLNDGMIQVSITGGTRPYHFEWRRNEDIMLNNSPLLTDLSDGFYHLHLTDAAGCTVDTSFYFPRIEPLICSISIEKPISCFAMADAILSSGIQGGEKPYSITWTANNTDTIGFGNMLSGRKSGKYTLSVLDSNQVEAIYELFLTQPDSLQLNMLTEASLCHQDSSGKAIAVVLGGTLPYQYHWNVNGEDLFINDSTIGHIENADIQLSITDRQGCMAKATAQIRAPQALKLEHTAWNPSYKGSQWQQKANEVNDGKIELFADGGTAPYRYLWNNGEESRLIDALDSGTYHITLTDSNNCSLIREIRLQRTPTLTTELKLLNEPACADSQTAAFSLSVHGGRRPYTYYWYKDEKWIGDDSILLKTNMGIGIYKVFLHDAHGIISCDSLRIQEPDHISVTAETKDATAWTFSNGSIHLNISGGVLPYRIFWNNGERQENIENLQRGIYKADIYDFNHCHTSINCVINSPDSLMISSLAIQHFKEESHYGFIKLSVQGGIKPYRYHWADDSGHILLADSGNKNLMELNELLPGLYHFYLVDEGGAFIEQSFEINETRKLEAALWLEKPIYCHGEKSAVIQAWIRGGTEPYTCIWTGISDSLQTAIQNDSSNTRIENLPAGDYSLQVYDANHDSCSVSLTVTQAEPLSLSAEIYPKEDTSNADGIFVLMAQGGRPPYRYLWNTGNTQNRQAFYRDKTYQASVTDAEGCMTSIDLDSVMSRNLRIALRQTNGIRCFGEQTASIEVNIFNGKAPFAIKWSNGLNTSKIESLPAGTYTVNVVDALGRRDSGNIVIQQPQELQNHITTQDPSCSGLSNGNIKLYTTGGNGHYTYAWNNGECTPNCSHLSKGTYIVRVHDHFQCTRTDTVILNEPEAMQCILQIDSILCPNEKGRIAWTAKGGTLPYRHQWMLVGEKENGNPLKPNEETLIELAEAGVYKISISDKNNCRLDTSVALIDPKAPSYTLERERNLCAGQNLSLKVDSCDTTANLQYLWIYPDGKTSEQMEISTDLAGTHQLTIIQNRQCIYHDSVNVTPFPDSIHVEFWVSSRLSAKQSCLLVNLSEYMPDSIVWHIPENVTILNSEGSYLEIQFPHAGLYTVGLTSFKGLCYESVFRQIEVVEEQEKSHLNLKEHSIRWRISPNPTRSNCFLSGKSGQSHIVRHRLVHAGTGKVLTNGTFTITKNTQISRPIFSGHETAGMYILILEYGNERNSFKIVKL